MIKSINKMSELGARVIILTGGEITEIPNWYEYIKDLLSVIRYTVWKNFTKPLVVLESNGSWITDPKKCSEMHRLCQNPLIHYVQVSSNKNYYRSYNTIISNTEAFKEVSDKIRVLTDWQGSTTNIKYLGRARNLIKDTSTLKGNPSCANLCSRSWNKDIFKTFEDLINNMELSGYFCTPMIDINGNIRVGESQFCQSIGTIVSSNEELLTNIQNLNFCNYCQHYKNVDHRKLEALGKTEITNRN